MQMTIKTLAFVIFFWIEAMIAGLDTCYVMTIYYHNSFL